MAIQTMVYTEGDRLILIVGDRYKTFSSTAWLSMVEAEELIEQLREGVDRVLLFKQGG